MPKLKTIEDLQRIREQARRDLQIRAETGTRIIVGMGTCGIAAGARETMHAILGELKERGMDAHVITVGCIGMCSNHQAVPFYGEIPFYKKQMRIILRNCGLIDPENIEEYIARDGYQALAKVLASMSPQQVYEEVKRSRLRGRGGAGFLTGLKWEFTARAQSDVKYVVCNADEGDPGAFMDRSVIEGDPHSLVEGMTICAYATGAQEGYVYCRAEYPLAIKRLKLAIARAEEYGLLGDNILGTDFCFHLHVKEGAGAFVCGEETALLASIEGRRGEPAPAPTFSRGQGAVGQTYQSQQRQELRQRAADPAVRRRVVRRYRLTQVAGHGHLCPDRQSKQHRPGRSTDGHHPGRDHFRHRRRRAQRQDLQGRADRRPAGWLHPGPTPQCTGRF